MFAWSLIFRLKTLISDSMSFLDFKLDLVLKIEQKINSVKVSICNIWDLCNAVEKQTFVLFAVNSARRSLFRDGCQLVPSLCVVHKKEDSAFYFQCHQHLIKVLMKWQESVLFQISLQRGVMTEICHSALLSQIFPTFASKLKLFLSRLWKFQG